MGKERHRFRSALVVAEVALALLLLVGAGLLLRSFLHVRATDPGFRAENVLSMDLMLPPVTYQTGSDVRTFIDELSRRLSRLPGVMAVGAGTDLPLHGTNRQRLFFPDDPNALQGKWPPAAFTFVYGAYFQALGIPLKRGRLFTDQDRSEQAPVLIVNETMARQLWPGRDPIGRRVKFGPPKSDVPWQTVVGVVADVRERTLERDAMMHSYAPLTQVPLSEARALADPCFAVRSSQSPEALIASVRSAVTSLDPQMPVANLETMEQSVEGTLSSRRIQMYIIALFAGAALLLSVVGVYGVVAYSVTQRTQEIGIRMALGATGAGVVRMVVRQGLMLTGFGVAAGIALSTVLTRYIVSLLFGVEPTDLVTFAAVAAVLLIAAAAASLVPARRAMRVDPMIALRRE